MSEKIYCLFATCDKFETCGHDKHIIVDEKISLIDAKRKYLDAKFCEDWRHEPKCPECKGKIKRIKGNKFECTNSECVVIEVEFYHLWTDDIPQVWRVKKQPHFKKRERRVKKRQPP